MQHPRIKRDPKVMFGKSVIAGTRIMWNTSFVSWALAIALRRSQPIIPRSPWRISGRQNYAADYLGHESLIAAE